MEKVTLAFSAKKRLALKLLDKMSCTLGPLERHEVKASRSRMKRFAVYVFVVFLFAAGFSSSALADSTANYSITGIYGTGTPTTSYTGAGQSFAMSFSVPSNPAALIGSNYDLGNDFYVYPLDVTYSFEGVTSTITDAVVAFYVSSFSSPGGFLVDFCVDVTCLTNLEYQWNFQGPQQYTGPENNPTVVPSNFLSNGQTLSVFNNDTGGEIDSLFNATVNGAPVNTPEPSSLLLLGAGLAGIVFLAKFRG